MTEGLDYRPGSADADCRARGVVITGMSVTSAFGHGTEVLRSGVLAGEPAFSRVTRFDPALCRASVAAELPGQPVLADELVAVISQARAEAGIGGDDRSRCPLLLGLHSDPAAARQPSASRATGSVAAQVSLRTGLSEPRVYTGACVAASTAIADAAALIASGRGDRVVVAAGYLVEADSFSLFDTMRTLAADGALRPFSKGRRGMLLGDGVAAVVLESAVSARVRDARILARLAGWGRAGDAYHVCQPRPDGTGLARAIDNALRRAKVSPAEIGYVNASGSGTPASDAAEAAALHRAFGPVISQVPVSSTKSTHGHALEASALIELVVTVLALRAGQLPVNAGFLAADEACELDLVLGAPRRQPLRWALSVNSAFGGANTALLVGPW